MKMNQEHKLCKEKDGGTLYKIGMFAAMNRVTVKTLRFYEEQGLLMPALIHPETGYRYYTLNQMAVLHQISALKQAGFTLEEIASVNSGADEEAVLIKTIPECSVAYVTTRLDSYDCLFEKMPAMGELMEKAGCVCALPEYCFTNYLEPADKDEDILVELCEAVEAPQKEVGELKYKVMPEVQAACIFHKGSYNTLTESYQKVLNFIEENDYEVVGEIRENYIDGAWNKEDESEWLTEIQVPVSH